MLVLVHVSGLTMAMSLEVGTRCRTATSLNLYPANAFVWETLRAQLFIMIYQTKLTHARKLSTQSDSQVRSLVEEDHIIHLAEVCKTRMCRGLPSPRLVGHRFQSSHWFAYRTVLGGCESLQSFRSTPQNGPEFVGPLSRNRQTRSRGHL